MIPIPKRDVRYQGAVIQNGQLLLLQHVEHATGLHYWILPGGGIDPGETEEECVARELIEETGLTVAVERLLVEQHLPPNDFYNRRKTYLCRILSGVAAPGYDPEPYAVHHYGITAVDWIELDRPDSWSQAVTSNERLMLQLRSLIEALSGNSPLLVTV